MKNEDYPTAEDCFRRTLILAPDSLETMVNLGYALDMQGHSEEALSYYESVLAISPQNTKAHYNRAMHLLRSGDLLNGFTDYEFRFAAIKNTDSRVYAQPRWDGSLLNGRSILVYCEQGLGDAIQFSRYILGVAKLGGRVLLEAQQPLVSLLSTLSGVEIVIAKSGVPPVTDCHIPLLSLPYIFKTTLDTVPAPIPYLTPDPSKVKEWSQILAGDTQFKVGLVWRGSTTNPMDRDRSCCLDELVPLLAIPGISYYSLQVGSGADEITSLPQSVGLIDLTERLDDFSDTAALMANLDLIISVDTAVVHLAGAMGKAVWVVLAHRADWRWMREGRTSPWYPTMLLFRQLRVGDWGPVIDAVGRELKEMLTDSAAVTEANQESEENRFKSALQSLTEGKYENAISQLNALLAEIPDDPALWFNLGQAYDLSEQWAKAVECYVEALQIRPDSPAILFCLGKIYLEQKSFADAEVYLRRAHEQLPQSIEILLALGGALVQRDDAVGAFECCHKMLAIDPECEA